MDSRTDPTADLAAFVSSVDADELPARAVRLAERAFVDTVGVTLAGVDDDAAAAAAALAEGTALARGPTATTNAGDRPAPARGPGGDGATLLGRDARGPLLDAVLANATAGHALDFDDVCLSGMDGHPSVTMVAPVLAVAEATGASGRDCVAAYVAGFEAQCYLAAPISPGHYERGWHATATVGTFGAAAAVANLLDLSADRARHALNVAASTAGGLKRNFGTATKPVHAGLAARAGTTAALLAREGVDADPRAVDGERGFYDLFGGEGAADLDALPALGERWAILADGIDLKRYPCCYYTHAAVHAAVELADETGLDPAAVRSVRVRASRGAADALHHDDPDTGAQAKFSMPYVVACALVRRRADLAAFEADALADHAVEVVRERTSLAVDDDLPYDANAATVTVETADGTVHERSREQPPATHDDPLPDADLREKFESCAGRALDPPAVASAHAALDSLREVEDAAAVARHL